MLLYNQFKGNNKIKLDIITTWKELLYEPLEKEDVQEIIKSDSVKIVDLGICKMALPDQDEKMTGG